MLKNFFRLAFRNFRKNKTSSAINISGLTIGITCCLLISLYIRNEINYDGFQEKASRIARVIMEYKFDGGSEAKKGNYTSVRVAPVFQRTFPEVEAAVRMVKYERVVKYNDKLFSEKNFMFADPSFFKLFSFRLVQGNPNSVLASPNDVVLTASSALKYFGSDNPVGKTLRVGSDSILYRVTGIIQDCPSNSQIKFDFLAAFSSLGIDAANEKTYWEANYTTYLLLKNKNSVTTLQARIPAFMKKEMEGEGATINFFLEPFLSIHLHSEYGGFEPNNDIMYIYILAAVALLILVIACSTYINLGTARSIERVKEVGVRKVIGAGKKQLFLQFMGESALLCLAAVILGMLAAIVLLPYLNMLTDRQLQARTLFSLPFILFSVFVAIFVSLMAGSYPALIITGFNPVMILKGSYRHSGPGGKLRQSLIVFQFMISVFLIISTFTMQKQLSYIQHTKLGYDREHILVMPMDNKMLAILPLIKQAFKSNPGVISVSRCGRSPVEGGGGYNMRSDMMPSNQQMNVTANPVDEDYISTTGLQLIAGADFSEQDIKDVSANEQHNKSYHFILNESAAKQLGWTAKEAVGKKMFLDNSRPGFVRGVVKDFHFESLHKPIGAFVLFPEVRGGELLLKLGGQNLPGTIAWIGKAWKEFVPGRPFEYHFMDEDYNKLYNTELRLGSVMNIFAVIAIVLACLGLFGLSSYSAQQRIKEIGVRKILGASLTSIVAVLSKEFVKLALIAILIAFPLTWWATTKWMQDFAYRTSIGVDIYLGAGALTILLAMLTVSFHAIKAATANPVNCLRTE